MQEIMTILNVTIETAIIIKIIELLIIWLFLISAIKIGVKKGIIAAEREKQIYTKTPKEDFEEEMKGWN